MISAFIPLLTAVIAVFLVALLGLTQRSLFGTPVEDVFYGFFFNGHPLFIFAVVYGLARIVVAAFETPWAWIKGLTLPLAMALLLLVSLYPTFGGLVLRGGFMTSSMSFLQGVNLSVATVLGAGIGAFTFGAVMGAGAIIARLKLRFGRHAFGMAVLSFLALWLGALMFVGYRALGLHGAWPRAPLGMMDAIKTAALATLAALPHTLVLWARFKPKR
jgi:hypothetical protein